MLELAQSCQQDIAQAQIIFAGFSFGSYVAYRASSQMQNALLISIAPPVHHFDYTEFSPDSPWIIVQGDSDDVVPCNLVQNFVEKQKKAPELLLFANTGHFFHGKLLELKKLLLPAINKHLHK